MFGTLNIKNCIHETPDFPCCVRVWDKQNA